MPGFDKQSARRISNAVRGFERLGRSRTPRVSRRDNVSKNPFYWAIALTNIARGSGGTVQLINSDDTGIPGETRNAFNEYDATIWINSKCLVTVVDGEFRIVAADTATHLLCSTVGAVSSINATFTASVVADLDGHFQDTTITAHNTFSQDYDPSELFIAFRDEENFRWVADKVGGSGGNEALVRFELTESKLIADFEAAAEILDQDLNGTAEFVIVHDRVGEWAGVAGYQGMAFRGDNVGGEYDILFLEGKARWIRAQLNANVGTSGSSVAATVLDYWGGAPNGKNPGTTVSVWDETGEWFFLKSSQKIVCVLDEKQDRYVIMWGEFRSDVFAVNLVNDGGVVGVNGTTNCSLTYTVKNADTDFTYALSSSPLNPRPSLTQMVPATKGLAHWEDIGGAVTLILDHAFEVPTPRTTLTVVSSVVCNPSTGIDVYTRQVFLPVGSRTEPQALAGTLLCVGGGGGFIAGCGIVETTPGSGVYMVDNTALAGDGIAVDPSTSCGLKVDHDDCSLELIGTSPNKKLYVRLKSAGGLDCSSGVRVDPAVVSSDVIKSISGCILEIDEVNETLKLTLEYQPYTINKNSAGVFIGGSFGAATALAPCTVGVEECP